MVSDLSKMNPGFLDLGSEENSLLRFKRGDFGTIYF